MVKYALLIQPIGGGVRDARAQWQVARGSWYTTTPIAALREGLSPVADGASLVNCGFEIRHLVGIMLKSAP